MNVSHSFRTACLIPVCTTLLVSCALTGGHADMSHAVASAPAYGDPHMQRFYALQAEIDRLQRERDQLARRLVGVTPSLALSQQAVGAQAGNQSGGRSALLQARVDRMLSRLDKLRVQLADAPLTQYAQSLLSGAVGSRAADSEAAESGTVGSGAVGGESSSSQMAEPSRDSGMQQKAAGEVSNSVAAKQAPVLRPDQADVTSSAQKVAHAGVGEIAPSSVALPTAALPEIQQPVEPAGPHHQSRWSYSVVYRYDQQNPWDTTWQRLEQQGEQDKWRGRHAQRSHYFIYVGVYAGERMAQRRADELLAQVGEAPDILARQKVAH